MEEENVQRVKRFKVRTSQFPVGKADTGKQHQSYQETLKHVHLPPALDQSGFDHDIAVRTQSSHPISRI